MSEVYDFFVSSYSNYSKVDIVLEFLAFWFGIISVVFAKKQNILVYPTGIICTIITMYLMYKVSLLGHILVPPLDMKKNVVKSWYFDDDKIYSFDTRFKISKKYTLAFVIKN